MLIDSHCHILSSEYDNVYEVIKEAFNNKVDMLIINGFDVESSKQAVKLSEEFENVYAAVGIGPDNIKNITKEDIDIISNLANNKKVVAIGEIGLDYYWTTDTKEIQKKIFGKMLEIAKLKNLPVIVHSRNAIQETYNFVKKYNIEGIMHCYSGSYEMAREFIKIGFLIGVGGVITFKNAKQIKEIVEKINISNISLETDCPYLSPEPKRGKQNVPQNLIYIASKIAEIKNISYEEVVSKTGHAVMSKFDL